MRWHRAWYGNWNQPDGVRMLDGSFDFKEILKRAKATAKETGEIVTVEKEIPTLNGLTSIYYDVYPNGSYNRMN